MREHVLRREQRLDRRVEEVFPSFRRDAVPALLANAAPVRMRSAD